MPDAGPHFRYSCPPDDGATVYIVDDEIIVRQSLEALLNSSGLRTHASRSAEEFLTLDLRGRPGCVILDMRMPGMSGVELLNRLGERRFSMPVIMLSAYGNVPTAVRAMRGGAIDFIEKPYSNEYLVQRVRDALEMDRLRRQDRSERVETLKRLAMLTPRENDVLEFLLDGQTNKAIADRLGVSSKTVESHRARLMIKMAAESLAELIRKTVAARGMDAGA